MKNLTIGMFQAIQGNIVISKQTKEKRGDQNEKM